MLFASNNMKVLLVVSFLSLAVASSYAEVHSVEQLTAYNYHMRYGVPLALKIKRTEEDAIKAGLAGQRIVGGSITDISQVPYQVGLIILLHSNHQSVAGGVLISNTRVVTAAHNHFDGSSAARSHTVVLGSNTIFFGGHRQVTSNIVLHPQYNPFTVANDIAVMRINHVSFTHVIQPISLPVGAELNANFVGENAVASGFGQKFNGAPIPQNQPLSSVTVPVIANSACSSVFGSFILHSNICTSGAGGRNICTGDSGGPLAVVRGNRRILAGITSFGSSAGCQAGQPSAYARVTSFRPWILSI